MKKRAFISVYDNSELADFAKNLTEKFEYEIVADDETYKFLKDFAIDCVNINQFINNSDLLVHESDSFDMTEDIIAKFFDMVVINICQPYKNMSETGVFSDMISKIDIRRCLIARVAAKYYKKITVITEKSDYFTALNANENARLKLAAKAYNMTAVYDRIIADGLLGEAGDNNFKNFSLEKLKDMKCGENPHQKGSIYKFSKMIDYEVLNNRELSFNNILNVTVATNIVSEFYDVNSVAIIRHTKPCGVALGRSLYEAYTKAFDCDPVSSFYGTVGFSKPVNKEAALHINSMSVEAVVAPGYDEEALELFKDNTEIKLIKLNTSLKDYRRLTVEEVIMTPFGVLVQDKNSSELDKNLFKVVTKKQPTTEQIEDAVFAWKVVKHAKTNAVVIAKDFKSVAITQGQTNVICAVEAALDYACDDSKDAVLASDALLPAEDCIYSAVQGRISLIIQPGGSLKDQQLIDVCNKYDIAMITTGIRNYRY